MRPGAVGASRTAALLPELADGALRRRFRLRLWRHDERHGRANLLLPVRKGAELPPRAGALRTERNQKEELGTSSQKRQMVRFVLGKGLRPRMEPQTGRAVGPHTVLHLHLRHHLRLRHLWLNGLQILHAMREAALHAFAAKALKA